MAKGRMFMAVIRIGIVKNMMMADGQQGSNGLLSVMEGAVTLEELLESWQ